LADGLAWLQGLSAAMHPAQAMEKIESGHSPRNPEDTNLPFFVRSFRCVASSGGIRNPAT
jgi:hypothetical protein